MKLQKKVVLASVVSTVTAGAIGLTVFHSANGIDATVHHLSRIDALTKKALDFSITAHEYTMYGHDVERCRRVMNDMFLNMEAILPGMSHDDRLLDDFKRSEEELRRIFETLVVTTERLQRIETDAALARELEERLEGQLYIQLEAFISTTIQMYGLTYRSMSSEVRWNLLLVGLFTGVLVVLFLTLGGFVRAAVSSWLRPGPE